MVIYKRTVVDLTARADMGANSSTKPPNHYTRGRGAVHRLSARLSGRKVGSSGSRLWSIAPTGAACAVARITTRAGFIADAIVLPARGDKT